MTIPESAEVNRGGESSGFHVSIYILRRDINYVTFALVKFVDFTLNWIDTDNLITSVSENNRKGQANITQTKNADHCGFIGKFL